MVAMPTQLRAPLHPGGTLADTIEDRGTTRYRLSRATGLTQTALGEIIAGDRGITARTALLLGWYFGTSPKFWLNLQTAYDLDVAAAELAEVLERPSPLPAAEGVGDGE